MSIRATMRALQQTSLNGPQDLRLITDAPVPVPGPGEVLIRVTAAGVNFGDISQARGTFLGGPRPPYLAGFEAAGEIAAVGEAVTGLGTAARAIGAGIAGVGGATLGGSLAAAERVTGRVVVYGVAGGEAPVTNWELVYKYQVHVIGLNIGVLIQAAPQIFGEVMGELFALIAAGVLTPGQPTAYDLADGPKALAELQARATVGKLALLP